MAVTETQNESWISRLGKSFKNVVLGVVIFIAAFPVLFKNESRSVNRSRELAEGEKACISVDAASVDPANEGALVHMSGIAKTAEILRDEDFGVERNAISLEREVLIYQWTESVESYTEERVGGGTTTTKTYNYSREWVSSPRDSSKFKEAGHDNVSPFEHASREWSSQDVTVGAFRLVPDLIARLGGRESITNEVYLSATNGTFSAPVIGDMRISWSIIPGEVAASIVAQQRGEKLAPYRTSKGGVIALVSDQEKTAAEMFSAARRANQILTWLLRFGGFLMFLIGIQMVLRPLSIFASVLPLLGKIVGMITGTAALFVALALTLVTVAIAWFVVRPVLAIALIAAAVASVCFCKKVRGKK